MKFKVIRSILSIYLVTALMFTCTGVSKGVTQDTALSTAGSRLLAQIDNKNEVVYATLMADGKVNSVYVVNHFEVAQSGNITDYGDYTKVTNLTGIGPIIQDGDSVFFPADSGNFYYQGNMASPKLPWKFEISYYLDGVNKSAKEIAGKSGKLEIHFDSAKNKEVDPAFYENYMLQISMTLDAQICSNISAPDGTIASAGNSKAVVYTVMPGKDAAFQTTADVKDFVMNGIEISAMPFSMNMDLPDTDQMLDEFAQLPKAISDLNDGVGELVSGIRRLKRGANDLKNGSSDFQDGMNRLKDNAGQINGASLQIKDALSMISSSLSANMPAGIDLGSLAKLPSALTQLSDGLKGISGGLKELKTGFSEAFAALDQAIQGIPDTMITGEQIAALYANTDPGQHGLLDRLIDSYTAGQTAKGTYTQVKGAFEAVGPTIDTLSASIDTIFGTLDTMSNQISGSMADMDIMAQLAQLSSGVSELAANYAAFHTGLAEYMNGVDQLADGYSQFNSGIASFASGVGDLYEGVQELHDGTGTLNEKTATMPEMMQFEIDRLMGDFVGSDFDPISFVSPKNEHTGLVQFVLKCEGIKMPEEMKTTEDIPENTTTVWDRLLALFTGKNAE